MVILVTVLRCVSERNFDMVRISFVMSSACNTGLSGLPLRQTPNLIKTFNVSLGSNRLEGLHVYCESILQVFIT
jgi:hypothetical protein